MRICFYAPFKPLGHEHPSGDLVIATGLVDYLSKQGHDVRPISSLRTRWIYWRPWLWPQVLRERRRAERCILNWHPDLWLTYHTYYKGPDLLGPAVCRANHLPYVVFQGIYSTKRRRDIKTAPGYYLNKKALLASRHVFTNRQEDWLNLKRLIPQDRLTYVAPGIYPEAFRFDAGARDELRRLWQVGDEPVVLSAAMFRPGVKSRGLAWVIRTCGALFRQGRRLHLVIAGDGMERMNLLKLADHYLPGRVRFAGKIARNEMHRFYSAADLFAFPGIRESLGMVFLEAQACGLPVVAFDNGGIPEIVRNGETGFLLPPFAFEAYADALERLLSDAELRHSMGSKAARHVRRLHDLNTNYRTMEKILEMVCRAEGGARWQGKGVNG